MTLQSTHTKSPKKRAVIIYSGGMDSFTLLHHVLHSGYQKEEVACLTFNYGQRHVKEIDVARRVCHSLQIEHEVIDISAINAILGGSSLTDDIEIPEGHYAEESMKSTVVPNRNMILLSLAVGYAVSLEATQVFYGAHSGDHAIYPDCRPEFVQQMNAVCEVANYEKVTIETPFLHDTKGDILARGLALDLDYINTWTCYNGREHACGKCGACVERLEAFAEHGQTDPLIYEGA